MTNDPTEGIRLANDLMDALHVTDLGPPDPQAYDRADSLEDRVEGADEASGVRAHTVLTGSEIPGMARIESRAFDTRSATNDAETVRVDPRGVLHVAGVRFASGPEALAWLDPRIPAAASVLRGYIAALRREAAAARIEAREMRRQVARLDEWIELHGSRS